MADDLLRKKLRIGDLTAKAAGRPDLLALFSGCDSEDSRSLQEIIDRGVNGRRDFSETEIKLLLLREYLES